MLFHFIVCNRPMRKLKLERRAVTSTAHAPSTQPPVLTQGPCGLSGKECHHLEQSTA